MLRKIEDKERIDFLSDGIGKSRRLTGIPSGGKPGLQGEPEARNEFIHSRMNHPRLSRQLTVALFSSFFSVTYFSPSSFFFNLESRRSECTDLKSEATPTEALFPLQTGRATIHEIDRSIEKDERAEKRAVARIPRKA